MSRSDELTQLRKEMRKNHRRIITTLSGSALMISGVLLLALGPGAMLSPAVAATLAALLGLGGGAMLFGSYVLNR